jgi:hypothetical protein
MAAAKSLGNITVTYNSNALTSKLNQASIEAIVNAIDVTNLASSAGQSIPGLANWSVPVGGFWDSTLDGYLGPDAVSPPSTLRTLVVVVGPSGSQATYTWTTNAFISNYKFGADNVSGALTWTGTLAVSGPPTRS